MGVVAAALARSAVDAGRPGRGMAGIVGEAGDGRAQVTVAGLSEHHGVSFAAGVGTPALDGLGIVGGEIHTPNEYAEVESMVPRFYLLTHLIMELGPGPK